MPQKNKLSIIVPVYNEVRYLDEFTKSLFSVFNNIDSEYIFVNDGSSDGSKELLENINETIILINLKENKGKGYAIKEGIKASTGNFLLFQDADLELDPKDSLEMYNIINDNNKIDCVFGSRYLSGKLKKNNNYLNEVFVKFNSFLFNILFRQSLSDLHCGSKIISKKIINQLNLTIDDFGFEIDIASQIAKNKFDIYEYGISYFARSKKEGKKITWIDGIKSYFYLFKTRFLQNEISVIFSIAFTVSYMIYIASFFGMGLGKYLLIGLFAVIGLFIGLYKKILTSSIIFLFCFIGSLFSKGNGKIYTVLLGFIIGLYISKKISLSAKKFNSIKLINFFI